MYRKFVRSVKSFAEDTFDELIALVMDVFHFVYAGMSDFGGDRVSAGAMGVLVSDAANEHGDGNACAVN